MSFKLQSAGQTSYIEADPTVLLIRTERDVLDLVSACHEYNTYTILLYESNLTPDFFDLKTRLAGEFLQKLVNYQMRGAGIISVADKPARFKELVLESNRGSLFRFFEDKTAAERWLGGEIS